MQTLAWCFACRMFVLLPLFMFINVCPFAVIYVYLYVPLKLAAYLHIKFNFCYLVTPIKV